MWSGGDNARMEGREKKGRELRARKGRRSREKQQAGRFGCLGDRVAAIWLTEELNWTGGTGGLGRVASQSSIPEWLQCRPIDRMRMAQPALRSGRSKQNNPASQPITAPSHRQQTRSTHQRPHHITSPPPIHQPPPFLLGLAPSYQCPSWMGPIRLSEIP
ncbi:hypothetical protein K440DRAFT_182815 [Wilcoxina mikolae CBS 423.85]|nr:hypothetical protein K440DRAFT_182815 [Wilcoxina mikolae CBS 423.85]